MKISKNSNNKAGTNKSQGNWNFTKSSKILAKFSFTGYNQTQRLKVKQFIPNKEKTS